MKTVNSRTTANASRIERSTRRSVDENAPTSTNSRRSSQHVSRRGSTNPANIIAEELALSRKQSAHRKSRSRNSQASSHNPLLGDIEKILNSTYQKQMKPPGRSSGTLHLLYF